MFSIYIGDSIFLVQTTMQYICLALLSSLSFHLVFLCNAEEGLEFPNFDGKDRVLDINERNYKKALKRYHLLCLFYHEPIPANKGLQKRFQMTELVLEVRTDSGVNLAIISFIYNYFMMLLAQNMDFFLKKFNFDECYNILPPNLIKHSSWVKPTAAPLWPVFNS